MKKRTGRVVRVSAVGALLAGLVYSAMALATPAYASSCDCTEAHADAVEICDPYSHGALEFFFCPTGTNGDHFTFQCSGSDGPFYIPCSY